MGNLLKGKRGVVFGVANNRSIAWGIAQAAQREGAELAFTYLNEALEKRVRPLAESVGSELVLPCDVQNDSDIEAVFAKLKDAWGGIDFVVHSVAYANADDLKGRFHETSREGFALAMDVSAYSLVAVTNKAVPVMNKGGSIVTLTYLGAAQVVPHYRVMGVAKAALEACVRELAVDLGPDSIRVNAISAGPIKTLAASGISDFRDLLGAFEVRSPLRKLVTIEDVGDTAIYLLSDLARAVTGEVHYVDGGFNITTA
ncbi:MAG: enoyl-ACP reductase FabI [Bdellovibrionales bacterium]|nr:enoyl-ACP reductase FabI [Bdellovibrionales bacterium]